MEFDLMTERLFLRQPTEADTAELFLLMSDERLTQFLTWEPHTEIETTKAVIISLIDAQKRDKGYHWCVLLNNKIIGLSSLIDVRRTIRTWTINRAELSYWIGSVYQGKGYATEASRKIIDFGFKNLGFHKIIVAHAEENIESGNICRKLHFSKYAVEHDAFYKNHKWHDLFWYELINNN